MWADVVGAEVADNARPVQLREGRLVVTTSSSAWAQTLQSMSPMVIARLNERLGDGVVEKAVFRHAGWDASSAAAGLDPSAPPGPATGKAGGSRTSKSRRPSSRRPAAAGSAPEDVGEDGLAELTDEQEELSPTSSDFRSRLPQSEPSATP